MSLTDVTNTAWKEISKGNASKLANQLQAVDFGKVLRAGMPIILVKKDPAASTSQLATLESHALPEHAKAGQILWAYSRAGTVTGVLTVVAKATTPTTGQIAIAPNGDIVVLAADAITSLDVAYLPVVQDVFEVTLSVASNSLTIPTVYTDRGVIDLIEAEITAGTSTGVKIVLTPSTGVAAAGYAKLNVAKTAVTFNGTDAATAARIKFSVRSELDFATIMDATSTV